MRKDPSTIWVGLEKVTDKLLGELKVLYPGQPHKEAIWEWQFSNRLGRDCAVVAARDEERLIGFNALMPVNLLSNGSQIEAWWSCDFIVSPSYRGQGIGGQIKDTMLQRVGQPVLSMGISAQAWPILLNKGWEAGPSLLLYERVFLPQRKRQWLLRGWGDLLSTTFRLARLLRLGVKTAWDIEPLNALPDTTVVDALWRRWCPKSGTSIVKNHAYLHWRYADFPFPCYRYLLIRARGGNPRGLVVYRQDNDHRIEITDYLGPKSEAGLLHSIVRLLKRLGAKSVLWRVQDPDLHRPLTQSGFLRKRYATRFVFRPWAHSQYPWPWSLSSGDSDGDFLSSAKDYMSQTSEVGESSFRLEAIDLESFKFLRAQWDELLSQSNSNTLFMSWSWQYSWWMVWGERLGLELRCFCIYQGARLVGILPLFRTLTGTIRPAEYQFIGNAWRIAPSVRSEYISPILACDKESDLLDFLENWFYKEATWSVLVVPDHIGEIKQWKNALIRQKDKGYRIRTQGNIHDYLDTLGKNTRLRAFNRLDYLSKSYPDAQWGVFEHADEQLTLFFNQLNRFHEKRWGRPCFQPDALSFHRRIIEDSNNGIKPILHYLKVGGKIRSLSYNLWVNGTMYNMQSGFEAEFDKKLSLGTLHFGKLITICFEDDSTSALDLLAGTGKRTDYKNHFQGEPVFFNSLQVFPSRVLYVAYALIARTKAWLRPEKEPRV